MDTIHVKKNKSVILDIYTNLLRNSVAHHFTPHHTITTSYRYRGIGITKSYSMMMKEKGGGMKYRIYFGGWGIDVDRGGGGIYCII